MALILVFGRSDILFKKFNYNNAKIYTIKPDHLSTTLIRCLHLLTDEEILLTFNERDVVYKHLEFLNKFLEDKKNE